MHVVCEEVHIDSDATVRVSEVHCSIGEPVFHPSQIVQARFTLELLRGCGYDRDKGDAGVGRTTCAYI